MKVSKIGGAGVLVLALILAVVPLNSKDYKGECGSALAPANRDRPPRGLLPTPEPPITLMPDDGFTIDTTMPSTTMPPPSPPPPPSIPPPTETHPRSKLHIPGEFICDEAVKNRRILSGVIAGLGVLILGGTLLKSESSSSSRPVSPPLKPEPKVEEPKEPESQPTDTKSFCSQCGEKLTIGAKFCSACGVVV